MQEYIGKTFAKWTVLSYEGKFNRVHKFKVQCICGNQSITDYISLTRGKSTQCKSCARKQSTKGNKNPSFKHGYASPSHPQFHMHYIWSSIKQRCNNPKTRNYHCYGGRGIKISPEWENNFIQFVTDMGQRPKGYAIDRINNDLGYCKSNCRWVTVEENSNNTSLNIFYEYNGERLSEIQWSRKLGISRNKFKWWARKYNIEWVFNNIEIIKKTKQGMADKEYIDLDLPLPNKCYRKY